MIKKDEIIAMAVAVIAEELGTEIKRIKIVSFRELGEEQEDNNEHLPD